MRKDMYEVLIERPRGGQGWGRRWQRISWRCLDLDEDGVRDGGPTKQRIKPRCPSKWLNENLAPLRRFLVRRLGRPWNEVYSEICEQIAMRSAVQKHVIDHLRQYVELHPIFIDGRPHHPESSGGMYHPLSGYGNGFYVCPESGRLALAPRRTRRMMRAAQQADAVR